MDGWDCIVPDDRFQEYMDLVLLYEDKIGNKELGKVEFTEFEWMAQLSVNDYIAKKKGEWVDGKFRPHKSVEPMDEYKTKGDFACDFELHKNSSFRIIPLALREYFANGTNPEVFINQHQDIFDFCARSNSGSTYIHYGYKGNQSFVLPKLIRYFVSKDGIKVKKIVKDDVDTGANDQNIRPAEYLKTVCNKLSPKDYKDYLASVERKWYIETVKEKIFLVEHGRKPNLGYKNENQASLF